MKLLENFLQNIFFNQMRCFLPLPLLSASARGVLPLDGEVRAGAVRDPADPLGERLDDAAGPLPVGVGTGLQARLTPAAQGLGAQPRRRLVSDDRLVESGSQVA